LCYDYPLGVLRAFEAVLSTPSRLCGLRHFAIPEYSNLTLIGHGALSREWMVGRQILHGSR
jgi:hypothetical protein